MTDSDNEQEQVDKRLDTYMSNCHKGVSRQSLALSGRTQVTTKSNIADITRLEFQIEALNTKNTILQQEYDKLLLRPNHELHSKIDLIIRVNPDNKNKIIKFIEGITSVNVDDAIADANAAKRQHLSIDRCELVHSELEMLSLLHKFKPERYVEYAQLIVKDIKEHKQHMMVVDIPQTKYGAHLVAFRAVLRNMTEKDKLSFTLLDGAVNVQNISYTPTKGMITPRIDIPKIGSSESTKLNSLPEQTVHHPVRVTGISIDSRYVQDIIGIYRISAAIISTEFRELDFYNKYKFSADKLIRIYQREYIELQDASKLDYLDIVKWITSGPLMSNGNVIVDVKHCVESCLNYALQYGASKVAVYLLNECMNKYELFPNKDKLLESACASKNKEALKIALEYCEYAEDHDGKLSLRMPDVFKEFTYLALPEPPST